MADDIRSRAVGTRDASAAAKAREAEARANGGGSAYDKPMQDNFKPMQSDFEQPKKQETAKKSSSSKNPKRRKKEFNWSYVFLAGVAIVVILVIMWLMQGNAVT
ncbi:MAG: hypothetical protein IJS61_02240 [Firmicutes bacterium]|nr:hypothetical protein [Bacillota bacterium]